MKHKINLLYIIIGMSLFFSCVNKNTQDKHKQESKLQLKIAAYNVEVGREGTPEEIGKILAPYHFQVVCMSEVPGGDWAKRVGKVAGLDYVILGRYSTAGHKDKYKAILSKTPLYGQEEVLMADTLHTVTKAKTKIGNNEISIYSVHYPFGWRNQAHIDETTNKIATFVKYLEKHQATENIVVAGDFNFSSSNSKKRNMYHDMHSNIGLKMTWKSLGTDLSQLSSFIGEGDDSGEVIDHIFYNPKKMDVSKGNVIELEHPLSDHNPVWALLEFK